jgi:uncharacterized membrane protein HdeD (DUF308 family)
MLKELKIMLGVTGVLLVILGILCMSNPGATLLSMALWIGVTTFVSGICWLVFSIRSREFLPNSGMMIFQGVLMIIIGILFLMDLPVLALSLPFVFTFWIFTEGLSLAIVSFDFKKAGFPYWWIQLLLGIFGVLASVYCFYHPVATGIAMSLMLGMGIISNGIYRFVALAGLNRFEKEIKK